RSLLIFEVSSIVFSIAHSSQGVVAAVFVDIIQVSLNVLNGYFMIGLTAMHSVANLVMSVSLQCVNKREDKIERKLDVRYQVKKNLKILPIFIRIGTVCVGWQVVNTTLFVVSCTELYALTATVILLSSSLMKSSRLFKLKRKERNIEPEISEGQLYLEMLKRQWN
ncbi:hypothetical protein PRIPAC_70152, partial [Pristionchus pacificus]|uniref:Uncharacterized protein n=1 Tax=Pristionchus pacificus TaxID=54126 RepID=A0A2A6BRK4_PRIPA